jgi:hypothetical protein
MGKRDSRVTAYIDRSQPFARPLLRRLRASMHAASPRLVEDIKWGMPAFLYDDKIVGGIAGFKAHCALWFWKGSKVVGTKAAGAMGQFGRITRPDDLPSAAAVKRYVKRGIALIEGKER